MKLSLAPLPIQVYCSGYSKGTILVFLVCQRYHSGNCYCSPFISMCSRNIEVLVRAPGRVSVSVCPLPACLLFLLILIWPRRWRLEERVRVFVLVLFSRHILESGKKRVSTKRKTWHGSGSLYQDLHKLKFPSQIMDTKFLSCFFLKYLTSVHLGSRT